MIEISYRGSDRIMKNMRWIHNDERQFKKLLPSFVIFAIDNVGIDGSNEQWCTVFMIIDSAKRQDIF